jgi:hypothetical protein
MVVPPFPRHVSADNDKNLVTGIFRGRKKIIPLLNKKIEERGYED